MTKIARQRTAATKPPRSARLAEDAFSKLRRAILTGDLQEGDLVRELRLAREWKISRTPLREAIRRAAECGYVILRPNHAPVVRKLFPADVLHIYALREVLECFALEVAWPHLRTSDFKRLDALVQRVEKAASLEKKLRAQFALDVALHRLWIDRSRNPWLGSILDRLLIYRPNYQSSALNAFDDLKLLDAAFVEHKGIVQALGAGRLRQAKQILRRHIRRAATTLAALYAARSARHPPAD